MDEMKKVQSFEEWDKLASELDGLEGNDRWKEQDESPLYDYEVVREAIKEMEAARNHKDWDLLWSLLRRNIARDFAGIDNPQLYNHCRSGTKRLIERFRQTMIETLTVLMSAEEGEWDLGDLKKAEIKYFLDRLGKLRAGLGRSALWLSGGFNLGFHHLGIMEELRERHLLPKVICASSGGAAIASAYLLAAQKDPNGIDERISSIIPMDDDAVVSLKRLWSTGNLLDAGLVRKRLSCIFGNDTFLEFYERTGYVLNIAMDSKGHRLLNYVTSPDVVVWSAVMADSSLPFLISPTVILQKNKQGGNLVPWDKTLEGDTKNKNFKSITDLFNVTNTIVSEVNIHLNVCDRFLEFVSSQDTCLQGRIGKFLKLVLGEARFRSQQVIQWIWLPEIVRSLMSLCSVPYHDNALVLPNIRWNQLSHIIIGPSIGLVKCAEREGRLATYQSKSFCTHLLLKYLEMSRFKWRLEMEMLIDSYMARLKQQTGVSVLDYFPWLYPETARKIFETSQNLTLASSYASYTAEAQKLDILEGRQAWKEVDSSPLYKYDLVKETIVELEGAQTQEIFSLLRSCVVRNFANIDNPLLYSQTHAGTKYLIERFQDTVKQALEQAIRNYLKGADRPNKINLLRELSEIRQIMGRTALYLSGGAALGFLQVGVVKALREEGLIPKIVCGSSCGSIVASIFFKIFTEKDFNSKIRDLIARGILEAPEEAGRWWPKFRRLASGGTLLDGDHVCGKLWEPLGEETFIESFHRTGHVLNVTVFSENKLEMPIVLNYVTAPDVVIASAICASIAYPWVLPPRSVLKKRDDGQLVPWHGEKDGLWIDGSIVSDIPMQRLAELFNVTNNVVVNVNPHKNPFMRLGNFLTAGWFPGHRFFALLIRLGKMEYYHWLSASWLPAPLKGLLGVFDQPCTGDVLILPPVSWYLLRGIVSDPRPHVVERADREGRLATYNEIRRFKWRLEIEQLLDATIEELQNNLGET